MQCCTGIIISYSLSIHFLLCSKQVLSPADKGRWHQSSREGSEAGELTARDQGHGQVRLKVLYMSCVYLMYKSYSIITRQKALFAKYILQLMIQSLAEQQPGCKIGPLITKLHGLTGGFGGFIILHNQQYMDPGKKKSTF